MAATTPPLDQVDVHIDLMCPYAYQTSKWLREVRDRHGVRLDWRFFSLEEINLRPDQKHPWERQWSWGWSMMRIGVLLRRESMARLDRWYEVAGRALHEGSGHPHHPDGAREILTEIGEDPDLVDAAMADPTTHDEIKSEHDKVVAAEGFGVPTMFFGAGTEAEQCLFGPVLIDPPSGDAADRLWTAVSAWVEFPHLYELQRPKTAADHQAIARTFEPYLANRDWVSINRGKEVTFEGEKQAH
ncbi:MAG: DsbA family protein [Acidimicrobiales bacterium]